MCAPGHRCGNRSPPDESGGNVPRIRYPGSGARLGKPEISRQACNVGELAEIE